MVEGYVVQMGVLVIVFVEFYCDYCVVLVLGNQCIDEVVLGSGIGDFCDDLVIQVFGRNCFGYQWISMKIFFGDFVDEGVGCLQGVYVVV